MMNVSYREYLLPGTHYIMSLFHLWKCLYAKNSWYFSPGPVIWFLNFTLIQSIKLQYVFAAVLSQTVSSLLNICKRLFSNLSENKCIGTVLAWGTWGGLIQNFAWC